MAKKKAQTKKPEAEVVQNNYLRESILGFDPGSFGVQLSQADTLFKNNRWYLISNLRQLLSQIYVENGIIQTIVDVPVDDAFRGGVEIKSKQLDEQQLEDLKNESEREGDLDAIKQGKKWTRLFGGGGVIILTDQDPSEPLDIEAISEDTPLEFRAFDMWELFFDQMTMTDTRAVIDESTVKDSEYYNYYGVKVHKSRIIKMIGVEAPSFVRPRLRGWGLSVVEAFVRSINQYLKATDLSFEVMDEFKIDIFRLKGLATMAMSKEGMATVRKRVQLATQEKNYQNAITLDKEDEYEQKQLSFAGIAETQAGIRIQVAADLRMPITKIFGISAAGFSSGEDDIENYNSMIESSIRGKSKYDTIKVLELRCQKMFGFIPDDLSIEYQPLRVLSSEQEENVKNSRFTRLLQAKQAGLISTKDFKEGCNKDKLLSVRVDPDEETVSDADINADDDNVDKNKTEPKAPKSKIAAPESKEANT